jgi:alanine dehydrogenase
MKVGVPREVKDHEYRVAITPSGVRELTLRGHHVYVEQHAGEGSLISDADFKHVGAEILERASDVWASADLLLKVKEPLEIEYPLLREGQVLFTYLHLAASKPCTDALLASRTTAVAYETVGSPDRTFPLLAPMSEVAGRLAPQVGAYHMMRALGGRGILPGGVPGTRPA